MPRQRFVYPTDEIAHLWAHQTQDSARNPQGNFYFKGVTLYFYRDSYPVGRIVTRGVGKRKKVAVLIQENRYSVTTAQHIRMAQQAARHMTTFVVPYLGEGRYQDVTGEINHAGNVARYARECQEYLERARRSRAYGVSNLNVSDACYENCREYCRWFGIRFPLSKFKFRLSQDDREKFLRETGVKAGRARESRIKARAASDARWARESEERRIAREQREAAELLELPEKIAKWRAGENVYLGYSQNVPTMLRLSSDGKEVETSHGARVPKFHARRALEFVRRVKAGGVEWVRNGHTFHLGHYSVNKVTSDGTLHAGCHVIPWEEIERFAPILEAATPVQAEVGVMGYGLPTGADLDRVVEDKESFPGVVESNE